MRKIRKLKMYLSAVTMLAVFIQLAGAGTVFAALRETADTAAAATKDATITVRNGNPVMVNGQQISSGATVSSGAQIETMAGAEAEVQIPPVGTLKIFPKTKLMVTFNGMHTEVTVERGCASLFVAQNYSGALVLPGGERKVSPAGDASELNSCDAETGAAAPQERAFAGLSLPALLALTIGGGAVTAGVLVDVLRGPPPFASPRRPCPPRRPQPCPIN